MVPVEHRTRALSLMTPILYHLTAASRESGGDGKGLPSDFEPSLCRKTVNEMLVYLMETM